VRPLEAGGERRSKVLGSSLYLPAAYPSMFAHCVHELSLSEDSACKRIKPCEALGAPTTAQLE